MALRNIIVRYTVPETCAYPFNAIRVLRDAGVGNATPGHDRCLAFRTFPAFTRLSTIALWARTALGPETESNSAADRLKGKIVIQTIDMAACVCIESKVTTIAIADKCIFLRVVSQHRRYTFPASVTLKGVTIKIITYTGKRDASIIK